MNVIVFCLYLQLSPLSVPAVDADSVSALVGMIEETLRNYMTFINPTKQSLSFNSKFITIPKEEMSKIDRQDEF